MPPTGVLVGTVPTAILGLRTNRGGAVSNPLRAATPGTDLERRVVKDHGLWLRSIRLGRLLRLTPVIPTLFNPNREQYGRKVVVAGPLGMATPCAVGLHILSITYNKAVGPQPSTAF